MQALNATSIHERPLDEGGMATVDAEDVSLIQARLQWQGRSDGLVPAQINLASVARHGRGCWLEVYGSEGTLMLGSAEPEGLRARLRACSMRRCR